MTRKILPAIVAALLVALGAPAAGATESAQFPMAVDGLELLPEQLADLQ